MSAAKLLAEARESQQCLLLLSDAMFMLDENDVGGALMTLKQLQQKLTSIDALLASGGWIPVSERLPEKNTDCLVFLGWVDVGTYEPLHKTRLQGESWFSEPAGINPMFNVTHWQPLPPLPEDKQ